MRAGLWHETTRIAYLGLVDPPRGSGAGEAGAAVDRRFRAFLHDVAGARPHDVTLSVTRGEVDADLELDTSATGELPVLEEEFEAVEEILGGDARWLEALASRGLDPATVVQHEASLLVPLAFVLAYELGRVVFRSRALGVATLLAQLVQGDVRFAGCNGLRLCLPGQCGTVFVCHGYGAGFKQAVHRRTFR